MNRRTNMPLLRSLGKDQGAFAAIDMALLRSFSNRFTVRMHVPRTARLPMVRLKVIMASPILLQRNRSTAEVTAQKPMR